MGDDGLVLLLLALLWRLVDSLATAAVWSAFALAGVTVLAALIMWAARVVPTGVRHRPRSGAATERPEMTQTEDDRGTG